MEHRRGGGMFRSKVMIVKRGTLPRKLAGIILAVLGIAIFADKIPLVVWWYLLGAGLIFAGWKLFTG